MQGERSAIDSFPETIDLNQGSFSNSSSGEHPSTWSNIRNPVESRLSDYMLPSNEGNIGYGHAANTNSRSFSGWELGASSTANNLGEGVSDDDSKMRHGWSSPFGASSGAHLRSEDWSSGPSSSFNFSYGDGQMTGRSLDMQNHGSGQANLDVNLSHVYVNEGNSQGGRGLCQPQTPYKAVQSETDQVPSFFASSSNVFANNIGTSSGSSGPFHENDDAAGPSLDSWGLSCKRKALEGTSRQFHHGGSSSSNLQRGSTRQHSVPHYTARGISISSGPVNLPRASHSEQLNPRSAVGASGVASSSFHPSSVARVAEMPSRNFGSRSNTGYDSIFLDSLSNDPRPYATHLPSRPVSNTDPSDLRLPVSLMNPSSGLDQSHPMHHSETRNMLPFPSNGFLNPRGSSSSSSFMLPRQRSSPEGDEVNLRNSLRNNVENPMFVSAPEARNFVLDPADWRTRSSSSRYGATTSRNSSGYRSSPTGMHTVPTVWMPQNSITQSQQRSSEFAPWIPSPHIESDSGLRRSHFLMLPSDSSSLDEAEASNRGHHPSNHRSSFLMEVPSDDLGDWRAIAADVEGRHRLIRQVLNAMRRGVHLRAEDYVLLAPSIDGIAEMHDRHRDMRLDVDNMSYEELLALEERIGNVNTGLSEEQIMGSIKQHKCESMAGSFSNQEPCCICQEEYVAGDDIATLDCRHEFHTGCIKQWLKLKNLCPICKVTALEKT